MKKHFLLAGIAALMLFACNNKPASELTLSGLDYFFYLVLITVC